MTIRKEINIYTGPIPIDKIRKNKCPERKTNQYAGGNKIMGTGEECGEQGNRRQKTFKKFRYGSAVLFSESFSCQVTNG